MSIQRFVLVLAMFAATAALPAQTIVTNGGFAPSGPNEARGWAAAYGTPKLLDKGCRDPWSVQLAASCAIRQPVALMKGVPYEISVCAEGAPVVLRASTTPLDDAKCPAGTCETAKIVTRGYSPGKVRFTPYRDYAYLTLSGAGGRVRIDNVSITIPVVRGQPAPLINAKAPGTIPRQFIVLLRKGITDKDYENLIKEAAGEILFEYKVEPRGFAVRYASVIAEEKGLANLRASGSVLWVEADQRMIPGFRTQPQASKGLDRIDRRMRPLNGTLQYAQSGQGVHAYVFDTGISPHLEFDNNRLSPAGYTAFNDGIGTADCNGHGTHVAGILGGKTFGVAKDVTLHSVRVIGCNGAGDASAVMAGIEWLASNKTLPAVANLSISAKNACASLDAKIQSSIDAGITYVVAASNRADDACKYSPAHLPDAITVGAVNPLSDVRYVLSNYGSCVDVYAPGTAILSAWHSSTSATNVRSGTSMAAPHVAGVAAFALELDNNAGPIDVWNKLHENNNVKGTGNDTPNWQGIGNLGDFSRNELLHWGPLDDGQGDGYSEGRDDGDPHLTTLDDTHYRFQSAGEFVLLRGAGVEIQTRKTPVATTSMPGVDPYNGLAACISINTAVAARVGSHKVTYQPGANGMQVRIDERVVPITAQGIELAGGGRVAPTALGEGLEIRFPDETVLTAIPGFWTAQRKWYLNLHVARTRATEGIIGPIARGSWLPALPDGTSVGPMPASLQQRHDDLYRTFANAWRVSPSSSLFDYADGTSTDTFTNTAWPPEKAPCALCGENPAVPAYANAAQEACRGLQGEEERKDCIFDVTVTGEPQFARTYYASQQLRRGGTSTVLTSDRDRPADRHKVTFNATVALLAPRESVVPKGTVQFFVDGAKAGAVPLDDRGRASWSTTRPLLRPDRRRITAQYIPAPGTEFLPSSGN